MKLPRLLPSSRSSTYSTYPRVLAIFLHTATVICWGGRSCIWTQKAQESNTTLEKEQSSSIRLRSMRNLLKDQGLLAITHFISIVFSNRNITLLFPILITLLVKNFAASTPPLVPCSPLRSTLTSSLAVSESRSQRLVISSIREEYNGLVGNKTETQKDTEEQ